MDGTARFDDRTDAGEQLGEELRERASTRISSSRFRGRTALGRAVADALDAPLDIVVAKKIGAPGNPEYAIGAVASDGASGETSKRFASPTPTKRTSRSNARSRLTPPERRPSATEAGGLRRSSTTRRSSSSTTASRQGRPPGLSLASRGVRRRSDRPRSSGRPTGHDRGFPGAGRRSRLSRDAGWLRGVGQFYRDFTQVSDEDAMEYLER